MQKLIKINTIWDFGWTGEIITVIFFRKTEDKIHILDVKHTDKENLMYSDLLKGRDISLYGKHLTTEKAYEGVEKFHKEQNDINFELFNTRDYTYEQGMKTAKELYKKASIDKVNCASLVKAFELCEKRKKRGITAIDWTRCYVDPLRYLAIYLKNAKGL